MGVLMGLADFVTKLNGAEQSIDDLTEWTVMRHSKTVFLETVEKAKSQLGKDDELVVYSLVLNGFEEIDKEFETELRKYVSELKSKSRYVFRSDVLNGKRTSSDVILEWLDCNKAIEDIKRTCRDLCQKLTHNHIVPTIGVLVYATDAERNLSPTALADYPIDEARKAKTEVCNYRIYKIS
jgi:hypothetical protein